MNIEVVVAIISGLAGVAGALIASIQAIRTGKLKAGADAKLEQIKAETSIAVETMKEARERRQKAFEIASVESAPLEAALAQAWEDLQLIKEIISKLASPDRYDLDIALEHLETPCKKLVDGYAKWGVSLPDPARTAWHKAKGSVSNFQQLLLTESKINRLEVRPELIERLKETRTFLTDYQMVIVATRQNIRDSNIKHLLELI